MSEVPTKQKAIMTCPLCNEPAGRVDKTTNTIDPEGWSMVVRRRRCKQGHSFETFECYEYADVEVVFRVREAIAALQDIVTASHP